MLNDEPAESKVSQSTFVVVRNTSSNEDMADAV